MAILESTQPKNLHLDEPNVEEGLLSSILSDAKKSLTIEVLFKQASTLQISGQWERARHLYQMWLSQEAHHPQKHLAMYNYGAILQSCGDLETAHKVYEECVSLCPKLAQAHINLGLVYESLGKIDQAIAQWSLLVSQQHQDASVDPAMLVLALNHIGRVHENQKRYVLAAQALEHSLQIDPKQASAIQHLVHIRQKACMWPVYQKTGIVNPNDMLMYSSPLSMLAHADDPVQQLLTAYSFVTRTFNFPEERMCPVKRYNHQKIRIGYVSGDLCTHAVGLLLPELMEGHDPSRFETYAYDYSVEDSTALRERLKNAFTQFRSIKSLSDHDAAQLIVEDQIDILVDLHGLSSGCRPGIFAKHPAPVQGTYLGFIGTTAMPWFDFVIADRYVVPNEQRIYFKEKVLAVDGCFLPLSKTERSSHVSTRKELGLPESAFVMASFGNSYKINPALVDSWFNILKRVDSAVLWLTHDNEAATKNLKDYAKASNIDLERLIFTPRVSLEAYRCNIKLADVFLDTYPYNCGSTTNDVIQAGVPMITLSGETMVSRMGGSILNALQLQKMIATDFQSYEDLAVELSTQAGQDLSIKAKAENISQATQRLIQSLEHGYENLYLDNFKH